MENANFSVSRDWINQTVFTEEKLFERATHRVQDLPGLLGEARQMENPVQWESRQAIFFRQARLLEWYEDEYEYNGDPVRYYPTYQSLTDVELRGYFSWRTQIRKGIYAKTSLSFLYLYIYELLNNIGVENPESGYEKLLLVKLNYGPGEPSLEYDLDQWLIDYVVYYALDKSLLIESPNIIYNHCIGVLENIQTAPQDHIIEAIQQLAPGWLGRSKFYTTHYEDMNDLIYRVLKKMSAHYEKNCKKTFVEQYFGIFASYQVHLFNRAIFCNPLRRKQFKYEINSQYIYNCANGIWSVAKRSFSTRARHKLDMLLKTIDALMREAYGFGHPIKEGITIKWVRNLIGNEIGNLLDEKTANAKYRLAINFDRLDDIRADAKITQEKLIVEEEKADPPVSASMEPPESNDISASMGRLPLNASEYRLLHCLLYGEDIAWIREEGHMLAVLVDGINDKLYDLYEDTVVDESPKVIEDYIDTLKEIITA